MKRRDLLKAAPAAMVVGAEPAVSQISEDYRLESKRGVWLSVVGGVATFHVETLIGGGA